MEIRCERKVIVYDSTRWKTIECSDLSCNQQDQPAGGKKDLMEYIKANPMPDDPAYSLRDLLGDFSGADGFITLPDEVSEEMMEYVAKLVSAFLT